MLDLETLGTRPGCSILSIGAVAFDPATRQLGPTFYTVINRASCRKAGLIEDRSTIAWWARQSEQARAVLSEAESIATPSIMDAAELFAGYLSNFAGSRRIWGCGADFDNAILAHIYAQVGRALPWRYTNNRCYRTLKNLMPAIKPTERKGLVAHNALDDAIHQAQHAMELLGALLQRP